MRYAIFLLVVGLLFWTFSVFAEGKNWTTADVVSFISRMGGWRGPIISEGIFLRWSDQTYEAKADNTVVTITATRKVGIRKNTRNGKECIETGAFKTTYVFDTRDMDEKTVKVSNTLNGRTNQRWLIALKTKGDKALIRRTHRLEAGSCPNSPPAFAFEETKSLESQFTIEFENKDAAERLKKIIRMAWDP